MYWTVSRHDRAKFYRARHDRARQDRARHYRDQTFTATCHDRAWTWPRHAITATAFTAPTMTAPGLDRAQAMTATRLYRDKKNNFTEASICSFKIKNNSLRKGCRKHYSNLLKNLVNLESFYPIFDPSFPQNMFLCQLPQRKTIQGHNGPLSTWNFVKI